MIHQTRRQCHHINLNINITSEHAPGSPVYVKCQYIKISLACCYRYKPSGRNSQTILKSVVWFGRSKPPNVANQLHF